MMNTKGYCIKLVSILIDISGGSWVCHWAAPDLRTPRTVIATTKGSKRLDGIQTRFAGFLKELQFEDKTGKDHDLFLETLYYTRLQ